MFVFAAPIIVAVILLISHDDGSNWSSNMLNGIPNRELIVTDHAINLNLNNIVIIIIGLSSAAFISSS